MRANDLLLEPVKKYRTSINPPYRRKDLISILGTLFILLAIPLTVFVAVKVRPWGPRAAGTAAAPTTIGSVIEPGSMVSGASYIVFADGTNYYARNGKTGEIQFSGSNDATPVIQAAIDALPATGGKVVLTEGTFTLSNSIVLGSTGTVLEGQGYGTLIQYNGDLIAGNAAIGHNNGATYRTVTDAAVRNLRIKNNGAVSHSNILIGWNDHIPQRITIDHVESENGPLWIYCGSHHRVEHSYVHDLKGGVGRADTGTTIRGVSANQNGPACLATDSIIANNIIENVPDMGITSILSDGLVISNNRVVKAGQDPAHSDGVIGMAIDVSNSINILISGNSIESTNGILSENADVGTIQIVNNIVKGTGVAAGVGIQVWRHPDTGPTGPQADRILISGNTVHNTHWGIYVADEDKVSITGNLVDNVGGTGIGVSKNGTWGVNPDDVLIEGNTVSRWAVNDSWQAAINANVANAKVSDNYLDGDSLNNNRGIAGLRNPGWITDNVIQNVGNVKMFEIEAGVVNEHNY